MLYLLNENNEPYQVDLVNMDFEKLESQKIVKTYEFDDILVSTVFLGLKHGVLDGKPVLFETMIFGGEHSDIQWRYTSYDDAVASHNRIVECVKDGEDPYDIEM